MSSWASFAESDQPAPEPTPEADLGESDGKVEDLAVGRLRLWLRGVFGSSRVTDE
jgi:hypothetical protein